MPFVKKPGSKQAQILTHTPKTFVGRKDELKFFKKNILEAENVAYNIISISGQGGVGKSMLLARFLEEARTASFKDTCLTALVDESQITPVGIMEKFADQLGMKGTFEKTLVQYKNALRKLQSYQHLEHNTFLKNSATEIASTVIKQVPGIGDLLEKEAGSAIGYLLDELHDRSLLKDTQRLEDPISDLTRAFVKELNRYTEREITLPTSRRKRRRRVLLFFDTFEQLALVAEPWLLHHFLSVDIDSNIVLVIAGRYSLGRSPLHDPKQWLPYYDNHIIHSLFLKSFTKEETRTYLQQYTTDSARIDTIWQLSHGLPLYLSLLTSTMSEEMDPTADVVDNFLRWIPEPAKKKRRLVLEAALLSRPFSKDDLSAFPHWPQEEDEREELYHWLIQQPFVQSSMRGGRYHYNNIARELFHRHLFQQSPREYYSLIKTIVHYYQGQIENISAERGEEVYESVEWLELVLSVVHQFFLLPDKVDQLVAIELVLNAYKHIAQPEAIVTVLHEVVDQINARGDINTLQIIKHLINYFTLRLESQEFYEAVNALLDAVTQHQTFSVELLAHLYRDRGRSSRQLKEYKRSLGDFDRAISLAPTYAWAYVSRGISYALLGMYNSALEDFIQALTLDPNNIWVYSLRGEIYFQLKQNTQALADFNSAVSLDPNNTWLYILRGAVYCQIEEYQQALEDFERAISLDPQLPWMYIIRGLTYMQVKAYKQALEDLEHAVLLDHQLAWTSPLRDEILRLSEGVNVTAESNEIVTIPNLAVLQQFAESLSLMIKVREPSDQQSIRVFADPTSSGTSEKSIPPPSDGYVSRRSTLAIILGLAGIAGLVGPSVPEETIDIPELLQALLVHGFCGNCASLPVVYRLPALLWLPGGKHIVSGANAMIQVWDPMTGDTLSSNELTSSDEWSYISTMAFSPDGARVALGRDNGMIRVWDVMARRLLVTYNGHSSGTTSLAWSPDGKHIASGSSDNTMQVWNAMTGASLVTCHANYLSGLIVSDIAWSPDGKRIASAGENVKIWNAFTGELRSVYRGHTSGVLALAWAPDGKRIASVGQNAQIWNANTNQHILTYQGHSSNINSVAWAPSGTRIVSGDDLTIQVWNAIDGKNLVTRGTSSDRRTIVETVAWSPDSQYIAVGNSDETVQIWDAFMESLIETYTHFTNLVTIATWSPNKMFIALAGDRYDHTVRVWNTTTGKHILTYRGHSSNISAVGWSPDSTSIISGDYDGVIQIWNATSGSKLLTYRGSYHRVLKVMWSPDGKYIAFSADDGSNDGVIQIWDVTTDSRLLIYRGSVDANDSLKWSPDGQHIALAGYYGETIRIWNVTTGSQLLIHNSGSADRYDPLTWSPDGGRIASESSQDYNQNGMIQIWDAASGNKLLTYGGAANPVASALWSPDGRRIASTSYQNNVAEIQIWDAASGNKLLTYGGAANPVASALWSPDSRRIASLVGGPESGDSTIPQTIQVWDSVTGIRLFTYSLSGQAIALEWSLDGQYLTSISADGMIEVWDTSRITYSKPIVSISAG